MLQPYALYLKTKTLSQTSSQLIFKDNLNAEEPQGIVVQVGKGGTTSQKTSLLFIIEIVNFMKNKPGRVNLIYLLIDLNKDKKM